MLPTIAILLIVANAVSSFSTLITFDVDGTLVSSSPGWEQGVSVGVGIIYHASLYGMASM